MKDDKPGSAWVDLGSVESFKTTFTVRDLDPNKKYFFAVSAENDIGVSEQCATEKSVSPKKIISKCDLSLKKVISKCDLRPKKGYL